MIVYEVNFWGLPLLGRVYGSAFPRALLFGGLSSLTAYILFAFAPAGATETLSNTFM